MSTASNTRRTKNTFWHTMCCDSKFSYVKWLAGGHSIVTQLGQFNSANFTGPILRLAHVTLKNLDMTWHHIFKGSMNPFSKVIWTHAIHMIFLFLLVTRIFWNVTWPGHLTSNISTSGNLPHPCDVAFWWVGCSHETLKSDKKASQQDTALPASVKKKQPTTLNWAWNKDQRSMRAPRLLAIHLCFPFSHQTQ